MASSTATRRATTGDHGIVFMAMCTSLFRQFEFVQQQWMQYGLDFNTGSDTCPVIGNHPAEDNPKLVIPVDPELGQAAVHLRPAAPARRAARRRLLLHPEHDRAADDRNGDRRPDLTAPTNCLKRRRPVQWLLNLPTVLWRRLLLIFQGLGALLALIATGIGALFGKGGTIGSRLGAALGGVRRRSGEASRCCGCSSPTWCSSARSSPPMPIAASRRSPPAATT